MPGLPLPPARTCRSWCDALPLRTQIMLVFAVLSILATVLTAQRLFASLMEDQDVDGLGVYSVDGGLMEGRGMRPDTLTTAESAPGFESGHLVTITGFESSRGQRGRVYLSVNSAAVDAVRRHDCLVGMSIAAGVLLCSLLLAARVTRLPGERLGAAERERLERLVSERTRDLEQSSEMFRLTAAQKLESVGRLAAGVAHEINTPVQFVRDNVEFVRSSLSDIHTVIESYRTLQQAVRSGSEVASAADAAAAAEASADLDYLIENVPMAIDSAVEGLGRIATIVRSMKEFAYPDQAQKTFVDLNHAIQSTLVVAHNEYKYIADAVKGTSTLGKITLRTRADAGEVEISVADSGTGIPAGVRDKVFDPFFTTKEVGKGTGQGLAIAHNVIVNKHGGSLRFETEAGKGTTFFVRLPIESVAAG
jgi:signal transduction histidine kinase